MGSCTKVSASTSDLKSLGEIFPDMTDEELAYLNDLSGSSLLSVVDCMLEGLNSFESILCCSFATICR